MADGDEPVEAPDLTAGGAMDRIDAALDRIAAGRLPLADARPDTAIIAARLDGLITRLREALAIAAG